VTDMTKIWNEPPHVRFN